MFDWLFFTLVACWVERIHLPLSETTHTVLFHHLSCLVSGSLCFLLFSIHHFYQNQLIDYFNPFPHLSLILFSIIDWISLLVIELFWFSISFWVSFGSFWLTDYLGIYSFLLIYGFLNLFLLLRFKFFLINVKNIFNDFKHWNLSTSICCPTQA